jgi:hypothetical protein
MGRPVRKLKTLDQILKEGIRVELITQDKTTVTTVQACPHGGCEFQGTVEEVTEHLRIVEANRLILSRLAREMAE